MKIQWGQLLTTFSFLFGLTLAFLGIPEIADAQVLQKETEVEGNLVIFKPIIANKPTEVGVPISRMCSLVAFQDIHHNQACGCLLKPSTIPKPHKEGLKYWGLKILADPNVNGSCMCQVMCEIEKPAEEPKP